jgi:hypothetical protein
VLAVVYVDLSSGWTNCLTSAQPLRSVLERPRLRNLGEARFARAISATRNEPAMPPMRRPKPSIQATPSSQCVIIDCRCQSNRKIGCNRAGLSNAVARGDINWESDVMRALYKLNRTVRDQDDVKSLDTWERARRQFHLTLIAGSNMPMLVNFCDVLHNLNDRYRRIFLVKRGGDRNVAAEHSEIAQAAVARDSAFACEKLREHIQRTGTNLQHILSNQIPA